ncbi:MAG: hypothetical protein ACK4MV_16525 [Beijerinckiaceae bacterium]
MSKIPFEVTDRFAVTIGGERVRDGIVNLSDAQAEHYLRMGVIRGLEHTFTPSAPAFVTRPEKPMEARSGDELVVNLASGEIAPAPRHPLDHDGDGVKGGSLPGRKRRARKPAQAGES